MSPISKEWEGRKRASCLRVATFILAIFIRLRLWRMGSGEVTPADRSVQTWFGRKCRGDKRRCFLLICPQIVFSPQRLCRVTITDSPRLNDLNDDGFQRCWSLHTWVRCCQQKKTALIYFQITNMQKWNDLLTAVCFCSNVCYMPGIQKKSPKFL